MKKIFSVKRNALLSPSDISGGGIALACVLAAVLLRIFFPGFFLTLSMPFVRVGNALSEETHSLLAGFSNASVLAAANESLTNENNALAAENRTLTDRVGTLSALLGDAGAGKQQGLGVIAGVVARPPVSPYDTLVVAKGTTDGIQLGMEAYGDGGVPIGTVTSVTSDFARITLFSAPGVSLLSWVGTQHLPLLIAGAGAGAFSATAPRATAVAVGDVVYAPGPGALPIGVVKRLGGDAAAPTVTLSIAPTANPFTLTSVVVRDSGAALSGALMCSTSTQP